MTDWGCFRSVCFREWRLMYRHLGELLQPLVFFILIACLMPLALPVSTLILQTIGPGVLWMGVLLAMQLSLLGGFSDDERSGTLSMWMMSAFPLSWILVGVFLCRWCRFMLPLLAMYPLLALMYHFTVHAMLMSELAIACGSWVVFGLGFVLSALLVRLLRRGWLLSCLMLPLCVPPLILVASIGQMAMQDESVLAPMALLGMLAMTMLCLVPWLTSVALRTAWYCEEKSGYGESAESRMLKQFKV